MNSIKIRNLDFSYGKVDIFKNFNLDIYDGMYGLLGRNGAGKSTLMKLILGILPAKNGKIIINEGLKKREISQVIGYLPQDFNFYPTMKVKEALIYLGVLDEIKTSILKQRIDKLLDLVNLTEEADKKIKDLSGGMRRRFGIAQSLLNDPKILIVDEPTVGLDPEERIRFRNLLSDLSKNKIVLFSTHIAGDLESTTNRVGILDKGGLIYDGDIENLLNETKNSTYQTLISRQEYSDFKNKYLVFEQKEVSEGIEVKFLHNGRPLENFRRVEPSLEAAYLMKIHEREGF